MLVGDLVEYDRVFNSVFSSLPIGNIVLRSLRPTDAAVLIVSMTSSPLHLSIRFLWFAGIIHCCRFQVVLLPLTQDKLSNLSDLSVLTVRAVSLVSREIPQRLISSCLRGSLS